VKWFQPTLRLRMALLYGGLVLLVGAALLFTAAILLDRAISSIPLLTGRVVVGTRTQSSGNWIVVDGANLGAQARQEARQNLLSAGVVYFGIVVIIGAAGGYFLAKQSLRPISRVTQMARRLSTETLDQRINMGGPNDELRELADTFDDMLQRLDSAFESQRRFVANASHELRTPLAVMRTEVDVTLSDPDAPREELRQMADVVRDATMRAERLVDSLLVLARLQARQGSGLEVRERVDLATLGPNALQLSFDEAQAAGITIHSDLQPAWVDGDPRLLERLMGNLVENAVRHNHPGGWVRVTSGRYGARVVLEVANGGAIVPPEEAAVLLEPFRRGARARTGPRGSGLGLSIVQGIVDAHQGRLEITAPPTGGLRIVVDLPAPAQQAAAGR
jgi:signal transduction histidine kinase